jgi:hypothetical protein
MDIYAVMTAVANAVNVIDGLSAYPVLPDQINPPCFGPNDFEIDYHQTFGQFNMLPFTFLVFTSRGDTEAGRKLLSKYLAPSGPQSIIWAIEADKTLGGAVSAIVVDRARDAFQTAEVAGVRYLGANRRKGVGNVSLTPLVLLDTKIHWEAANLTGYSNKVDCAISVDVLEDTTFGSGGYKERVGGLFDVNGSIEGFWQAGDLTKPSDAFWASLSNPKAALTLIPTGGAVGDTCYVTRAMEASYHPSGQVGELMAFAVDFNGNWPVALGQVLVSAATPITTTGNGTAKQVGAILATQALYASLHVEAAVGTSLAVKIQSATSSGFGSPTDRITFVTATTIGAQTLSVVGPITDTWWRAVVTVVGGSPSFTAVVGTGVAAK